MVAKATSFNIEQVRCSTCGINLGVSATDAPMSVMQIVLMHLSDPLAVLHGAGIVSIEFVAQDENQAPVPALTASR